MPRFTSLVTGTALVAGTALSACDSTTTSVAPVASVTVEPSVLSLTEDETAQLVAMLRDQAGNLLTGRNITWSSTAGLVAQVDPNGLVRAVGSGSAMVTATSEGRRGSAQVSVRSRARIRLSETEIAFEATRGETDPAPAIIDITNTGEAPLVNLATATTYVGGGQDGWLATSLQSTAAPTALTLTASVAGLPSGVHRTRVDVVSAVAVNSPQPVSVTFTVLEPPPVIELSTLSVVLEAPETSVTPAVALVSVTNGGGGTLTDLDAVVTYATGQPSGWLEAALDQPTAPATLRIEATAGALPTGTYNATIAVDAALAENAPETIAVTFTVVPRASASGTMGEAAATQ